ncbi:hypothetical protein [Blautia sp. An46]|uniref:hypothetical protein n=1 Tax=Blautia sp. An46 TaxID=1965636 RepID=UPI000B3A9F6C|nr:hypothetical protein [Blautia sp. An46]OUN90001.1 hypothetical protein B5G00_17485 [Blautia sp. An46]
MRLNKIVSGAAAAAMLGTMMCTTAFAADYTDGDYTGEIHFLNANGSGNYSMCDPIFVHEAELALTADNAELTFYVAYPIPSFPDLGTDGTILDVVLTVDGTGYTAESDITTKPEKVFDTTAGLFGITKGESYPTQVLTVDLPRDAVDDLEAGTVSASAYVNSVMNSTQNFLIQVTNIQSVGGETEPADTKDMQITADVQEVVSEPTYTVNVPESIELGTLSTEEDNSSHYTVDVAASNLNGTLSVSAPETGNLTSGDNTLAFANSFGTQNVTADTENSKLSGAISVSASDVAAAAAGNYTGTTTFSITYSAN